jgi:glycosyltransferase involved in cell wall biosynthesis
MKQILICANPDLNLIDGSSVWVQSLALALAETGCARVDILARSLPDRVELYGPLLKHGNIGIFDGSDKLFWNGNAIQRLKVGQMAHMSIMRAQCNNYDVIIVRGYEIAQALSQHSDILSKCWVYLTDIPQKAELLNEQYKSTLSVLARGAARIMYQSGGFYKLWKEVVPDAPQDKFISYSPLIPDMPDTSHPIKERPMRAIYAGKFAKDWKTLEMAELWPLVLNSHKDAELIMIGDKIHKDPDNPDYETLMMEALRKTPGLTWLGSQSREDVQRELGSARVGLSWRSESMNVTLEYSTKILEYGAAGCAVVLNRNPLHESLFGIDYPLFANSEGEFVDQIVRALEDESTAQQAADRMREAAGAHTFSKRVASLKQWLSETPVADHHRRNYRTTVLVAGHDLKFFELLQRRLEASGQYDFLIDHWQGYHRHNEMKSRELLEKADVIFCEWGLGNLKWYSHNKRSDQLLVARMHLRELQLPYLAESDQDRIDHISFVSAHIRNEALNKMSFPAHRTSVIANLLDEQKFIPGPKMDEARYTLGIIGISPLRKRIDRALDVLELLLEKDSRYTLRVKGQHPLDDPWIRSRAGEVEYYSKVFERINSSEKLRYRVIFDPPGDDINIWLSLVGFILSSSDFESFHMPVGEAMLTGCVPIVWNWEGAADIWPKESIVDDAYAAADSILSFNESGGELPFPQSREYVLQRYDSCIIAGQWDKILSGQVIDYGAPDYAGMRGESNSISPAAQISGKKTRYVLVKVCYGMGGRIRVLVDAIDYARRTGRQLIVDWNDGFYDDRKNDTDIFSQYFIAPESNCLEFYDKMTDVVKTMKIYPETWALKPFGPGVTFFDDDLSYNTFYKVAPPGEDVDADIVIFTWPMDPKYRQTDARALYSELKLQPRIVEKIDRFIIDNFTKPPIGVHVRHGNGENKVIAPEIEWFIEKINKVRQYEDRPVLLCTDSILVQDYFVNRLDNVCFTSKKFTLHGSLHNNPMNTDCPFNNGEQALVDLYLLSRCDILVISGEFFGETAILLGGGSRGIYRYPKPTRLYHIKDAPGKPISEFKDIEALFSQAGIHLDNMRLDTSNGKYILYYGYDQIATIDNIDSVDFAAIKSSLLSRRLYV